MLTIIFFVHNILNRGTCRLRNMFYSLRNQNGIAIYPKIIMVNTSNDASFDEIDKYAKEFDVIHYHNPIPEGEKWNKSRALNFGLGQCDTEYVMFSDADYIFAPNFLSVLLKNVSARRMILCRTHDSPPDIDFRKYDASDYSKVLSRSKLHGPSGVGACQCASVKWFRKEGGYDERFELWGVMDTDMAYRAKKSLKIRWISSETSIIHQWHKKKKDRDQKRINVDIYNKKRARVTASSRRIRSPRGQQSRGRSKSIYVYYRD